MNQLSLEDFRRFIDVNPALFCIADSDARFRWLSPAWTTVLGWSRDELKARPFLDLVHPDDVDATHAAMGQLNEGLQVAEFSNRYRRRDGGWAWLSWYSQHHDGLYYAVATEVTEQKDHLRALTESRHLLELAGKLAGVGHWRVDLQKGEVFWSEEVYRIHGLSLDFVPVLETAIKLFHPDDREQVERYVETAILDKQGYSFTLRIVRPDGEVRHVQSNAQVELDERGEVRALIGIFRDLTEQKAVQAHLQESERFQAVSTLAAGIAHELNNPLQFVTANVALALEQVEEIESASSSPWARELRELLDDAQHGLRQAARIVRDLRAFMSASERSDLQLVDLNEVLQTTVSMTRNQLRHQAQLVEEYEPLPKVQARQVELIQVFVNLVTNGLQAMENASRNEARLTLRSYRDTDGWAVVEVEDSGCGLPDDLHRIFEPFFTTKEVGKGTGLGLYVSRSIVQRSGGNLRAISRDGATVFRVSMPPAVRQAAPTAKDPDLPILVLLDDDSRVGRSLARMVRRIFHVEVVAHAQEAMEIVARHEGDVMVLCDVMMPTITGFEVLEQMMRAHPGIEDRFVLMSGAAPSMPEDLPDVPLVDKPVEMARLRAVLGEVLERWKGPGS